MFGLINRDRLATEVLDEFENLIARLSAYLLTEHKEDGTHISETPGNDFVPTGALMDWTVATAPTGWVLCDGRQLNRVEYKRLFDVIGITYGAGDGSLTFNVPDLRGKFKLGLAVSGTGSTLAGTGGAIDHAHTGGAITGSTGSAAPNVTGNTANESSHTHFVEGLTDIEVNPSRTVDNNLDGSTIQVADDGHGHDFSDTSSGGTPHAHGAGTLEVESHEHTAGTLALGTSGTANPPFIALPVIIKD